MSLKFADANLPRQCFLLKLSTFLTASCTCFSFINEESCFERRLYAYEFDVKQ